MSEYQQAINEKKLVDQYMKAGYKIIKVNENLNGMFIELNTGDDEEKSIKMLITTSDARKYVSTKMFYI